MKRIAAGFFLVLVAGSASAQTPASSGFRLSTGDFWLNLHQFLYVLGRAQEKTSDMTRRAVVNAPADQARGLANLNDSERTAWTAAVDAYASGPSRKDAVFDDDVIAIGNALAAAGDAPTLEGVRLDPVVRAALERAAPVYRKAWWPAHRAANERWRTMVEALLVKHGPQVLAFVTRAYGMEWPKDGYPVRVSGYANWAGAFSTKGDLLVVSSLDSGNSGLSALETIVHEAMHQWDEEIEALIAAEAAKQRIRTNPNLSHAMVFFTAGEAVRAAVPGYVTYAETNGMWNRSMRIFKKALDEVWMPWLGGQGTRDATIAGLVTREVRGGGGGR